MGNDDGYAERGIFGRRGLVMTRKASFRNAVLMILAMGIAGLAGCTPPAYLLAGVDPADPSVPVAAVGYHPTVAPYTSLRPAMPKSWREQNEQVAPAPKSGQ